MATKLKKVVNNALAALPDQIEIRRRIAENLQEHQLLRQMLKLVERRQKSIAKSTEGRRHE